MNKYVEYIRSKLDVRTLLEQLAEESAEFTQAVLKLIRAMELNNNYTPTTKSEAESNFIEEFTDLLIATYVFLLIDVSDDIKNSPKIKRWAERPGYKGD